jgi:hypothetical protein
MPNTPQACVEIIGVRHFSPACAELVRARIDAWQPDAVLIEGPSDFNARIGEFFLGHELPIALFCFADAQQSYAPFALNSPEWQALLGANAIGAHLEFIDLPYWHPQGRAHAGRLADQQASERWHQREDLLAARLNIEGTDALWDHLFEQALPQDQLTDRLSTYFAELRAGEVGDLSDCAREAWMARHIRRSSERYQRILVICGGWHKPVLEASWRTAEPMTDAISAEQFNFQRHGLYLIPYSERRLESYAGYGAGMPSPAFYRQLFEFGHLAANEFAISGILQRLREHKLSISTASLIAAQSKITLLARLRGHAQPMRTDILDGLLDTICQGDLSTPVPWTQSHAKLTQQVDPNVREALLALTGQRSGRLSHATPMPPLVLEVQQLLENLGLAGKQNAILDRRKRSDGEKAAVLWRLKILSISGVQISKSEAPGAARQLLPDQYFQETWALNDTPARQVELIEASAWGASLESAARAHLLDQMQRSDAIDVLADAFVTAVRASFTDLQSALLPQISAAIDACHLHGALGLAGTRLQSLARLGFWGMDCSRVIAPILRRIQVRLLWLIEGLSGALTPMEQADIDALFYLDGQFADVAIRLSDAEQDAEPHSDMQHASAVLQRITQFAEAPPTLRGAAFAVLWRHADISEIEIELSLCARSLSQAQALGDFLSGLFAIARNECVRAQTLLRALDKVIVHMPNADFLAGLPAIRQAFHFFPPRERAQIAKTIAREHGDENIDLLNLAASAEDVARAALLEARVLHDRARFGL